VAVLLDVVGDLDAVNSLLGTDFADHDALLSATTGFDALSFDAVAIDPSVGPEGLAAQIESAMLSAVAGLGHVAGHSAGNMTKAFCWWGEDASHD